jgi:hypothetical protein
MADLSEYENKVRDLQSRLDDLQAQYDRVKQEQNAAANAANRRRENLIASGLDPSQDAEYQSLAARSSQLDNQLQNLSNQLRQVRSQLSIAKEQLQRAQVAERSRPAGSDSSGQIVKEDGGSSGGALPAQQGPQTITANGRIVGEVTNPGGTNATRPNSGVVADVGTNAATLGIAQTQTSYGSTNTNRLLPAGDANPVPSQGNSQTFPLQPGVGAGSDDRLVTNPTQSDINNRFNAEWFDPQPNILDQYYSYTYNIEWYLVTPEEYRNLVLTRSTNALRGKLLVRSGGSQDAYTGSAGPTSSMRAPAFDLDFYIDDVVIKNELLGAGTGSSHGYTELSFRIIEPLGITFMDRLYTVVKQEAKIDSPAAALYALVVTFYGIDETGKIVKAAGAPNDPYAVVKKVIPFNITEIKFSVDGGPVTYEVTGNGTAFNGVMTSRGTVPESVEIRGSTVAEMLATGTNSSSQVSNIQETNRSILNTIAPSNASQAPKPSDNLAGNLMDALNKIQERLVQQGIYTIADKYSIEFVEPSIASARVRKDLTPNYGVVPMANPNQVSSRLEEKAKADMDRRILSIAPGTQIIQVIDNVIRNSSFILDQSNVDYDEKTGKLKVREDANPNQQFAWFKVNMTSTPIGTSLDPKRNDYAYDIKFIVSFYNIQGMDSPYFPSGRVSGIHKSYPYWFTGQNTSVLEYRQSYNCAYSQTLSDANRNQVEQFTDAGKLRKYVYAPRSNQSAQGAERKTNEPSSNASQFLYDQSALGNSTMRIIGDPAWMVQGEVFAGVDSKNFDYKPFQADGTINADRGEVLYEIRWAKSQDYNLKTGLMEVGNTSFGTTNPNVQSLLYRAKNIVSEFRGGKFEQTLNGVLFYQPVANDANKTQPATSSTTISPVANDNLLPGFTF